MRILVLPLLVLAMSISACVREPGAGPIIAPIAPPVTNGTQKEGGVDGGGGVGSFSTSDDIRSTIKLAMSLATAKEPSRNIYQRFLIDGAQEDGDRFEYLLNPEILFPSLSIDHIKGVEWSDKELAKKLHSPVLSHLQSVTPKILEDEYCPAPDKDEAEASVSSFDFKAELCFSVKALKRIPRAALLKEVLGLLLHETVHMAGGDEANAIEYQRVFDRFFTSKLGYIQDREVAREHASIFLKIVGSLFISNSDNSPYRAHKQNERRMAMLAVYASELSNLPFLFDPLALDIGFQAKGPQFGNNYVNSVMAIMETGWSVTSLGKNLEKKDASKALEFPPVPTTEEIDALYAKMSHQLMIMIDNLKAYQAGEKGSKCLLPQHEPSSFLTYKMSQGSGLGLGAGSIPKRVCDPGTVPAPEPPAEDQP